MRDASEPKLAKWPFFLGDILLLGTAYFLLSRAQLPIGTKEMVLMVCCILAGAILAVLPFILEYRVAARVAEAGALTTVVSRIGTLEQLASQIATATGQWQTVQEQADKTAGSVKAIADRVTSEAQAFTKFMQQVNDSEKTNLRLEVEKLRRAENDWLQVLVRMLDHVYALHLGAVRSGQANVIEQVGNFQNACRDAARRIGLAPFTPDPAEPFNEQKHQVLDGQGPPPPDAKISETVATGYTFQGRLLRPALVRLQA